MFVRVYTCRYINNPEMFAIGTSNLYDVGKASMRNMSTPTDPAAVKGTYNYIDEATTHFNLFSYAKYNRQQQLSCNYLADQQTQSCVPAAGGLAKATVDSAQFIAANGNLPYYKNASATQTYIDSSYVREAPARLPGVTLASLRSRGPGPETSVPSPAATRCVSRQVLAAGAATFGDGHAPGGAYLDDVECGWVIPGPSAGKLLTLSFSLFSCEVEKDYLNIYAGSDATAPLLGHYTGGASKGEAIPSVSSTTDMFVAWKTDNIMSRAWINPSEDGFTASYNSEAAGCSADSQCNGAGAGGTGAGTCDKSTGLCACSPGFGGSDCSHDSCFGTVTLRSGGLLKSHASGRKTSRNNARCVWELDTTNPNLAASLRFDHFDLEGGFDKLRVYSYRGTANTKTLLREFSGSANTPTGASPGLVLRPPRGEKAASAQRLTVEFSSDAIHMSTGFEITFEAKDAKTDCEKDADCSGTSGTCNLQKRCTCKPGFSGKQCECGPGKCISVVTAYSPKVHSITPSVISPKGGKMSIFGREFVPVNIVVFISDKVCVNPVYKSSTLIECIVPPGAGGSYNIVVSCGGAFSAPRNLLSYFLPHIYTISTLWISHGSVLNVTGKLFLNPMKCRLQGIPDCLATYIDDSHFECKCDIEAAGRDHEGQLENLEISNDGGQRWVTGMTVDSPIEWGGGALVPVFPSTITYPKEVVIGGIIPLDQTGDPEIAKQYAEEIAIGFDLAADSVNAAGLFPGGTQLRIEKIYVLPSTAVEAATAFAKSGIATNANDDDDDDDHHHHDDDEDEEEDEDDGGGGGGGGGGTNNSRITNVIGIAGPLFSSNAVPVVNAVSNPLRLPTISYDAWTSTLDSAAKFPYFIRTGPANSDISKVVASFFRSMQFDRIAVISDDDVWSSDYGKGVVDSVGKGGGVVLYHGIFPQVGGSLDNFRVVDKQGQLHLEGVKNITAHLHRAREAKARIVFVMAKSDVSRVAMYSALEETGFLGEGFAVIDGNVVPVTNDLVVSGTLRVKGVLHLTVEEAYACKAVRGCPNGDFPPSILVRVNQAHDAVYTLAAAIGPMFQDGGHSYLQGAPEIRLAAMAAIRSTSLSPDIAMSGLLRFPDPAVNNRDLWNFGYTMWNIVGTPGSPPKDVAVGRVYRDEFKLNNKDVAVIWPGGTTKIPQDILRGDPKNLSIGWVVESAWGSVETRQESRMYAQQAIDEINDNAYILPNTHLTLEVDERVQGNDKTVEAANAIEARAKAAGRPVAAMLGSSSSHMASLYDPQANATVTQRSTGVPIVGYNTGAGVLSDSKRFPNFVRLYPPVSEMQYIFRKTALQFGWNRVGLIGDKNDAYSTSFFDVMNGTDPTNPNNLQPPLRAASEVGPYDAPRLNIAHAALIDLGKDANKTMDALVTSIKAKDVKVFIFFGQTTFVDRVTAHGRDRGIFDPLGYQLMVSDDYTVKKDTTYKTLAALDGAIQILPATISLSYPGIKRSSKFWNRHPPTHAPVGSDTTIPFQVSGRKTRFQDASLYDAITLAAVGIEACLKSGCRPVGYGYDEVMPYIRAASIDGVAGASSIKVGNNDPQGRLFLVKVGKDPASRGLPGDFTFNTLTTTGITPTDVQVCVDPKMGDKCSYIASAPSKVKCFASSATSIDVEWKPSNIASGPSISGYRVTAFHLEEQIVVDVSSTAETRVTLSLDAAEKNQRVNYDTVYNVQVVALYANGMISSKAAACQTGLPCLPPPQPVDFGEDEEGHDHGESGGAAWNCPCYTSSQLHALFNEAGYLDGNGYINLFVDEHLEGWGGPRYPAARKGPPGAFYGGDSCISHDRKLPSTCADDTGKPRANAPSWCLSKWCYVHPAKCALKNTMSGYFPSPRLTYSYATCGGSDTFSATCKCRRDEFHTKGMPPLMDDPPLQPNGIIEEPAKDWKCEACMEGTECTGGTTSTISVQPGWFVVRSVSKATGAEKRPKLLRCRGGFENCPGGTSVAQVMRKLPPTAVAASRTCESITNVTLKVGTNEYEEARLHIYPQCQCGPGGTGMLCQACKSSSSVDGKDWVAAAGGICKECTMLNSDANNIVGAIMFGSILIVLCVVVGWWRYTRPSVVERRFVNHFARINELGAGRIASDFFGAPIGSGITKDNFVAAVLQRCGTSGDDKDALKLWDKLDEDGDMQVSLDEFVTFVCDLSDGNRADAEPERCKAVFAFAGSAMEWWDSMKSKTLRAVIIGHFQLMTSIPGSFPELNVQQNSSKTATAAAAAAAAAGNNATAAVSVTSFKQVVGDVTSAFANIHISVFEVVDCFLGPRHEGRLIYTTVTALIMMAVAGVVPRFLRCFTRGRRLAIHDAQLFSNISHFFRKGQLILIFLIYPALTSTIMRTFVCNDYAYDDQGNATFWLVDDTIVRCEVVTPRKLATSVVTMLTSSTSSNTTAAASATISEARPSSRIYESSPYSLLYAYAWCMVVVVVLGFPAIVYYKLYTWRHPFDRMYFVGEDGREKPTVEAMSSLSSLVMFRSGAWFMPMVDM